MRSPTTSQHHRQYSCTSYSTIFTYCIYMSTTSVWVNKKETKPEIVYLSDGKKKQGTTPATFKNEYQCSTKYSWENVTHGKRSIGHNHSRLERERERERARQKIRAAPFYICAVSIWWLRSIGSRRAKVYIRNAVWISPFLPGRKEKQPKRRAERERKDKTAGFDGIGPYHYPVQ